MKRNQHAKKTYSHMFSRLHDCGETNTPNNLILVGLSEIGKLTVVVAECCVHAELAHYRYDGARQS